MMDTIADQDVDRAAEEGFLSLCHAFPFTFSHLLFCTGTKKKLLQMAYVFAKLL